MTSLLLLILTPVIGQFEPGDHTRSIEVGSLTRSYIAHVPPIFACNLLADDDNPTEFKMRPIGHVKKSEDRTMIVLDKKYQPGLLGVNGYSHIYMVWWFDKNDTPEKRATLQVHPMGNGFAVQEVYANVAGDPYEADSPVLAVVAQLV